MDNAGRQGASSPAPPKRCSLTNETQQVASFFRGRADVEEKYGRSLVELGRNSNDQYARSEGKSG